MADLVYHTDCFFFETIPQFIDNFFNILAKAFFVLQFLEDIVQDIDEVEDIDNGEWIVECDVQPCHKFVELFISDEFVEEVWLFYHEVKDSEVEEIDVDLIFT